MTPNAITAEDRAAMAAFVSETEQFTSGPYVRQFEAAWAKWLGCQYAVFVNSGSSANLILLDAARGLRGGDAAVCQAVTWGTNAAPVMQTGMQLHLCDITLNNFSPDLACLERIFKEVRPRFLFLTHLLGFSAVSAALLELCEGYDVILLEDCCEAHGATFGSKKVGTIGYGSTFSFYYGHHMTTIEGGVVCTNDEALYHRLLLLRSHGLLRELPVGAREAHRIAEVDERFTFLTAGYNVRNMELNALLGLRQLERLDDFIRIRNENFRAFLAELDPAKYRTDFVLDGVSSFCLPILTRGDRQRVHDVLEGSGIESRPIVAGNLYRHPLIQGADLERFDQNAEIVNRSGLYVGNHQDVRGEQVKRLCEILDRV